MQYIVVDFLREAEDSVRSRKRSKISTCIILSIIFLWGVRLAWYRMPWGGYDLMDDPQRLNLYTLVGTIVLVFIGVITVAGYLENDKE